MQSCLNLRSHAAEPLTYWFAVIAVHGHVDARCRSFQMFDRAAAGIGGADQRTRRGADHDVWSDPALLECAQNTDVGEATQSTASEHQGYGSAGIRYCLGVLANRLQPEGSKRAYRGSAGMCPSPQGSGDERRCQEQSEDRHPMTQPPSGPDPSCQRVIAAPPMRRHRRRPGNGTGRRRRARPARSPRPHPGAAWSPADGRRPRRSGGHSPHRYPG